MSQQQEYSQILQELTLMKARVQALEHQITALGRYLLMANETITTMSKCIIRLQDVATDFLDYKDEHQ